MKKIIIVIVLVFVSCASIKIDRYKNIVYLPKAEYDQAWTRVYSAVSQLGYSFTYYKETTTGGTILILPVYISSTYHHKPHIGDNIIEFSNGLAITREIKNGQLKIIIYSKKENDPESRFISSYIKN